MSSDDSNTKVFVLFLQGPREDGAKVRELESKLAAQAEECKEIQAKLEQLRVQHEEDQFLLAEKDDLLQSKEEAITKFQQLSLSQKVSSFDLVLPSYMKCCRK